MTAAVWTLIAMQGASLLALYTALFGIRRDLADLRREIADLRGEMGEFRGQLGELRGEVRTIDVKLDEHLSSSHA